MIVSASRRTDIPAFFGEWFLRRLQEGFVLVRNPYDPRRVSRISLEPEALDAVVFWTKHPGNFLRCLDAVRARCDAFYVHVTLTPYGPEIEPRTGDKEAVIRAFRELSRRIGAERVLWRYDPILVNATYTAAYHEARFRYLCGALAGYTERCVVSVVDPYPHLRKLFAAGVLEVPQEGVLARIVPAFAAAAREAGIGMASCCEPLLVRDFGVARHRCVDPALVRRLFGRTVPEGRDPGQREGCGCAASRDIGSYGTCGHGCRYCYAFGGAREGGRQDPGAPILGEPLRGDEVVTDLAETGRLF